MPLSIAHLKEEIWPVVTQHLSDCVGWNTGTEAAWQLVIGTAAQESNLCYLKQLGGGPALGLWQMEPRTHDDIWKNWLEHRKDLGFIVSSFSCVSTAPEPFGTAREMTGNLYYAMTMARVHYMRVPEPLPAEDDLPLQASYWKKHYNTYNGAGTVGEYIANYKKYVDPR